MALDGGPQYYHPTYNPGGYYTPYPTYYYPVRPQVIRQGWECPKCGRVYSPDMIVCSSCGKDKDTYPKITWTTDTNTDITTVNTDG